MSEYVIALPFPPSVNSYYGHTCIGAKGRAIAKIYIKERGRNYRQDVIKIIKDKELDLMANIPLEVSIKVTPPDNRIHDIDNILKCLFDSLSHAKFWEDDRFVRKLAMEFVEKDHYEKPGSVLVHVKAL